MATLPPDEALAVQLGRAADAAAGPTLEVDPRGAAPAVDPGTLGCVVLTAPLEEVGDPLPVLRTIRGWLAPGGTLVCAVGNFTDQRSLVQLLRSDPQAAPLGVVPPGLAHVHGYATAYKLLLEAGWSPEIVEVVADEVDEALLEAAGPLLEHLRVHPDRAVRHLSARRYVFAARPIDDLVEGDAGAPLTFVACVNDDAQLHHNLLASPCLGEGSPHEVLLYRDMGSAAEGLNRGIREASHDLVVLVQQDVYLPSWWPSRLHRQWAAASPVDEPAVGGPVGVRYREGGRTHVGHCIDRDALFRTDHALPAEVDGLDEVLMVVPKASDLRFDPALGWHLYGTDLALQAHAAGRRTVALDVPCHHNSLLSGLHGAYHHAETVLAEKWPGELPIVTNSTTIDQDPRALRTVALEQALREAKSTTDELSARIATLDRELGEVRQAVAEREAVIASMQASPFWKLRTIVARAVKGG
ncbi:MAG TPA: hypothetical protein VJ804_16415 [Acidimicrobiales bacterium]|nr:hypothetical protein [Acidimicrobiales bacterium]